MAGTERDGPGSAADDDVVGAVNRDLGKLIAGQPVPVQTVDFQRKDAMQFRPKTKKDMCYIVMVVLFSQRGQVLLVQEAKKDCRGSWYLPAGRLEPNETFEAGAQREVEEEAGLTCRLDTMLSLHFEGACWMRINFLGTATGGKLKTLAEKDKESLQAQFFDVPDVFNRKVQLRCMDILDVIQQALEYKQSTMGVPPSPTTPSASPNSPTLPTTPGASALHPVLLPVTAPHSTLIHRVLLVTDCGKQRRLFVLAGREGKPHVVTAAISPTDTCLFVSLYGLINTAVSGEAKPRPTLHGVVSLEHNGAQKGRDGMCLTTLISLTTTPTSTTTSTTSTTDMQDQPPALRSQDFMWVPVTDPACRTFLQDGLCGRLCRLIE